MGRCGDTTGESRRTCRVALLALALACVAAPAGATPQVVPTDTTLRIEEVLEDAPRQAPADEGESDDEDEGLQQRLTEREDKRRPPDPVTIDLAGRPLVVGGEIEFEAIALWPRASGDGSDRFGRPFLELGLEAEAFYSFGPSLSLFAQLRLAAEEGQETGDCMAGGCMEVSDRYLERGEMWLYSEDLAGTGIDLDLGRLDFEDDRRWWWDEELDAVRLTFEAGNVELALAFTRELAPRRSDRDFIEPEHDRVQRLIAEMSWDWAPDHSLQLFALRQEDRSRRESIGQTLAPEREDDADARLTWLGARAIGVVDIGRRGLLGYWVDWARVRGRERRVEYEALTPRRSEVTDVAQHRVSGSAWDIGLNWLLPFASEPRLFAGMAAGSGDTDPEDGIDHSFQQTALHANEAGFGGMQRYPHYGVLLDPELSNLQVLTLGAGRTLLRSSSLDLVFHRYRLRRPAAELRDARLELELDAAHRDLGSALDLVLALEEWERFELFGVLSGFRPATAVVAADRRWRYGVFLAMRIAF